MALLTLEDWAALPEDESPHLELVKGVVVTCPPVRPHHNTAMVNITLATNRQLPDTLAAVPCTEVVIDPRFPATVRVPDVLVTSAARVRENPARFDAGDVLLAIEIESPGSRATDRITKLGEYAEAGIPHYWVIDLDEPATLTAHNLVEGRYEIATKATGEVTLVEPATITLDVSRLTELRY